MGRDSEFDAARGLHEGIHGHKVPEKKQPAEPAPAAHVTDLLTTRVEEDPEVTRRATELVKAKIAKRREKPLGRRLSLRDRVPAAGPGTGP
jgi:hypothetical protein